MHNRNQEKLDRRACFVCKNGGNVLECSRCNRFCHPACRTEPQNGQKASHPYRTARNSRKWWCSECRLKVQQENGLKKLTNVNMLSRCISNREKLKEHFSPHITENMTFRNLSKILNPPVQFAGLPSFQCPQEYINEFTDNSEKPTVKKNTRMADKNKKKLKIIQMSSTRSKGSSRFCHYCNKNNSKGPLILCDFCNLAFHVDCIDGGVSSLKRLETWMCPVHPEHVVNKAFPTKSLTKRNSLVKTLCHSKLNEEAIALRFMNQRKVCAQQTLNVPQNKVPEIVKHVYEERRRRICSNICHFSEGKSTKRVKEEYSTDLAEICHQKLIKGEFEVNQTGNLSGIENIINVKSRAYLLYFPDPSTLAIFYPIETAISIGTGEECDVKLDKLCPSCSRISSTHAHIFHDKVSDNYELLNYSQYGTLVDEIVYVNRSLVGMAEGCECSCVRNCDLGSEGNEESAVLVHGSEITIGCARFILSVDYS